MRLLRRSPPPDEVTFIRLFRKPYPRGWWPRELYSLGLNDCRLIDLSAEVCEVTREAHGYFYLGLDAKHLYPHLVCTMPEPLRWIVRGVFQSRGWDTSDESLYGRKVDVLVRQTWAFVHRTEKYAIFAPADSRTLWPGRNHKVVEQSVVPRAVRLLTPRDFHRLTKKRSHCFLASLGVVPL
jgi:hypothetical protein